MTLKRLNRKPETKSYWKCNNKFLRHPYRCLGDHKEKKLKISFIKDDIMMQVQVDFKNINYETFRTYENNNKSLFTS